MKFFNEHSWKIISLLVVALLCFSVYAMNRTIELRREYKLACDAKQGTYYRTQYGLVCRKNGVLIEMEPIEGLPAVVPSTR